LTDKKKPDKVLMKTAILSLPMQHLPKLLDEYTAVAGHPIEKDIEKQFSGDAKKALLALVQCSRNASIYFANLLNDSMKVTQFPIDETG
uniref:FH2 domain-containing protein n=1 Tax=Gongylonema pulchrum TaxID=637853 RepID=A0A183DGF9_9BILA